MAYIAWRGSVSASIDEIDAARRTTGAARAIAQVIDGMNDCTIPHFALEECQMEDAGYAFARPHQSIRQSFIKRVNTFKAGEDVSRSLSDQVPAAYGLN